MYLFRVLSCPGPRQVTQRWSEALHVSAARALQRCTDFFVNKFSL